MNINNAFLILQGFVMAFATMMFVASLITHNKTLKYAAVLLFVVACVGAAGAIAIG